MAFTAAPRTAAPTPLHWVAVGAVFAIGLGLAASAVTAARQLHVASPSAIRTQAVGLRMPHGRSARTGVSHTDAATPSVLRAAPAAVAATTAAAGGAAWVSWAALIVAIAAAVFSLFKRGQETSAFSTPAPAAPAPAAASAPPAPATGMDAVALAAKTELARRKTITPKQVIIELQRGNARFWSGTAERPEVNAIQRRALIIGQAPTVSLLSCADSRVPVEIVFDQGLGSMFVVRVAGNILDATAMGSLEFSVKYLGAKVILVMGHEACGAVKGAFSMSNTDIEAQPAYLQDVLRSIKGNLNLERLAKIQDSRSQDREAVVVNCTAQVKKLQANPLFAERVANGSLIIAGAFYEITSGIVDFFTLDKNGLVVDI